MNPKKMSKKIVTLVSSNPDKLHEFTNIYGPSTKYAIQHKNLDVAEYQGDMIDICRRKCKETLMQIDTPVIVEDTSLCFNAFGGLPGPYIKWFLEKLRPEGLHKMLAGFDDKSCAAVTIIGYAEHYPANMQFFEGITEGILVSPRGDNGFGWDSCFQPTGHTQTYAEMPFEMKNKISHRNKAIIKLREYLENE